MAEAARYAGGAGGGVGGGIGPRDLMRGGGGPTRPDYYGGGGGGGAFGRRPGPYDRPGPGGGMGRGYSTGGPMRGVRSFKGNSLEACDSFMC